jgi:hypothetical protein
MLHVAPAGYATSRRTLINGIKQRETIRIGLVVRRKRRSHAIESTNRRRYSSLLYLARRLLLEKAVLYRYLDWCGLVPGALPSWALPGVMFDRILVVFDDAKICLNMQAAHNAPLQRDDVVHDMLAPRGLSHEFRLAVDFEDGILVRPEHAALLATVAFI